MVGFSKPSMFSFSRIFGKTKLQKVALDSRISKQEEHVTGSGKPFVLIADDESLIRMDVETMFIDAGFYVCQARTGKEALSVLKRLGDKIQVLFTDVQMPPGQLSGIALARTCAGQWPGIVIVIVSGMTLPPLDTIPGSAIFVRKPFCAETVYRELQMRLPTDQQPGGLRKQLPASKQR